MTSPDQPGRIFDAVRADGHTQMAIDSHLLQTISDGPAVRFYQWEGPWLSLGRNQRTIPNHWHELAAAGELSLVHRPSGGDAVLHQGGLTYALIWPEAPRQRQQAYRDACRWLIDGFAALGCELQFGQSRAVAGGENCFARSTAADLIDLQGNKRIGSAQRWQHGRLLQHGEILLDPPSELWCKVFREGAPPAAGPEIPRQGLDQHLIQTLVQQWNQLAWRRESISADTLRRLTCRSSDWTPDSSSASTPPAEAASPDPGDKRSASGLPPTSEAANAHPNA